jgi:curved DNA-binding protein CbpA
LLLRGEFRRVTDSFALLGIPRAPWVDAIVVSESFQRLASSTHPDVAGGSGIAFAELNAAWQTLRDPASCLRHYLELEHPSALAFSEKAPPELGDLFMDIAEARQSTQVLATKLAASNSPLSRALLEGERLVAVKRLDALSAQIASRHAAATATLRAPDVAPEALAVSLGMLIFLQKWAAQLKESTLALA